MKQNSPHGNIEPEEYHAGLSERFYDREESRMGLHLSKNIGN
jgi:hypothetical protein